MSHIDETNANGKTKAEPSFPGEYPQSATPEERIRIISLIRRHLASYREVIFAYLHGSFIEGSVFRDIDIAIYFSNSIPQPDQLRLCLTLAAEISHLVGIQADVHSLNSAPVEFQYHATQGSILYSRDEEVREDFLESVWVKYFDLLPYIEESLADLLSCSDKSAEELDAPW